MEQNSQNGFSGKLAQASSQALSRLYCMSQSHSNAAFAALDSPVPETGCLASNCLAEGSSHDKYCCCCRGSFSGGVTTLWLWCTNALSKRGIFGNQLLSSTFSICSTSSVEQQVSSQGLQCCTAKYYGNKTLARRPLAAPLACVWSESNGCLFAQRTYCCCFCDTNRPVVWL